MTTRSARLQSLLDAARTAYGARGDDPRAQASLAKIDAALGRVRVASPAPGRRLPACEHLAAAADPARFDAADLRRLADAFLALEPSLTWRRRGGEAAAASANFPDAHANAMILGPGGLEPRHDVSLGVSLLAPHVRYPDHSHPPEETYLVMSAGEFMQGKGPWFEPGIGGAFYNPPGIVHAMRSRASPLFAFWLLWTGR